MDFSGLQREGVSFPAPTQVWHASARCSGRTLSELKDYPEFLAGSVCNVLDTVDGPVAPVCPLCGPPPPAPVIHLPAPAPAPRLPFPLNLALHHPRLLVARAPPPTPATAIASAPPVAAPPAAPAANAPASAPANTAVALHNPSCGCTTPKLAAVIDRNELRPGDILRYSNGVQVVYHRKRANEEYLFNRMNGVPLTQAHQGPKSLAKELAGGGRVAGHVWADFDVFRAGIRLGTLFDVRHAAYVAGRL